MKDRAGLIALLLMALAGTDLAACGDKFLVVGRGTRFQRASEAARPFSVLLYAPPSSALADSARRHSVEKALRRAGYRPATASSSVELAATLKGDRPDVVLAESGDAGDVERQLGPSSPGPIVLLKSSMGADSLLDAVDEAVNRVVKARSRPGF